MESESDGMIHLRCTINGGLEDLARNELQTIFPDNCLDWNQRGNSGSQLSLQIPTQSWSTDALVQAMKQLRFVEYVYHVVHWQNYNTASCGSSTCDDTTTPQNQRLLTQIQQNIDIDSKKLWLATSIGQKLQDALQDKTVGLESLPGEIIPTPTIEHANTGPGNPCLPDSQAFDVNTIYTHDAVAKMVVNLFVQKVQEYLALASSSSLSSSPSQIVWLDAGAGSGALLQHLPRHYRLGIDIAPSRHPEVVQANFLKVKRIQDITPSHYPNNVWESNDSIVCVISNPPFADGSRGDYSAIIQFLNHSIEQLQAQYVGLIVPAKFVRQRIWASLGIHPHLHLLARMVLPANAFWDPTQPQQQSVHIHSYFLIFGRQSPGPIPSNPFTNSSIKYDCHAPITPTTPSPTPTFYLMGKRDKGDFPNIATADLVKSVAQALSNKPLASPSLSPCPSPRLRLALVSEREAQFQLLVKLYQPKARIAMQELQKQPSTNHNHHLARLELWLLLNPERPLSLSNSMSCWIQRHSLGWMSLSVKPPVAQALLQPIVSSSRQQPGPALIVNTMSGEGTIELESQGFLGVSGPFFVLAGDMNESIVLKTQQRLQEFQVVRKQPCLIDLVVWDAQNLPLRRDIVDKFVADLPFMGSTKITSKVHQTPSMHYSGSGVNPDNDNNELDGNPGRMSTSSSLKYRSIMTQAIRCLVPKGVAALTSADTKALVHSTRQLHWKSIPQYCISKLNMGGLNGQLLVFEKLEPCTKDLSVWIEATEGTTTVDWSLALEQQSQGGVEGWYLDDESLELQQENSDIFRPSLVTKVTLVDQYYHEQSQRWSHCYRITMDSRLTNHQAKIIEKRIRATIEASPLVGISGFR